MSDSPRMNQDARKRRSNLHTDVVGVFAPFAGLFIAIVALGVSFWQSQTARQDILLQSFYEYRPYVIVDSLQLECSNDTVYFALSLRNIGKSSASRLFCPKELAVPSDRKRMVRPVTPQFGSRYELIGPYHTKKIRNPVTRSSYTWLKGDLLPGTYLHYFYSYEYRLINSDLLGDSIITYIHYGVIKFIGEGVPLEEWYAGEETVVGRPDTFFVNIYQDSSHIGFTEKYASANQREPSLR